MLTIRACTKITLCATALFLTSLSIASSGWSGTSIAAQVGDPFPPFTLPSNLTREELKELKLPPGESVSLKDFTSELILIELLNVYCHTCQLQVTTFNQLWDAVQTNKQLKSKVSFLGITVGNSAKEIEKFRKSFNVNYPLLADPSKVVFDSLGNGKGTPQTYLVGKDPSGTWFILYAHRGAATSHEMYLNKIKEFFKADLEGVEPGYKVPKSFLTTLKTRYPNESFDQKRILIYFPSSSTFSLEHDLRNTDTQLKVLLSLVNEERLAIVLIGFLQQILPLQELEMLKKTPHLFLIEDGMGMLSSQFKVSAHPLVCLINDSGRMVFRSDSLTRARAEELLKGTVAQLNPNLTEKELLELMLKSMKELKSQIERVEKKELENGETIYLGFTTEETDEALLLGRVVSKYSICDVCHDIHYYYILDQNGYIVSFTPLSITKYGNVPWDPNDIEKMKSRIVGKDAFKNLSFDPSVDAVTQATMSSYLVFEGLKETKTALNNFKDNGFRKGYWRGLCLGNLCEIKKSLTLIKKRGITERFTLEDQTSLDVVKLKTYLPSLKLSPCPLEGKYLLIGEIPICSFHGMNLEPCPEESTPPAQKSGE